MEFNKILQGNVLDVLKTLPENIIDCVVTSPPYYGLRDYGENAYTIWGGDTDCEHEWETERTPRPNASGGATEKDYKGDAQHYADYNDRATYSKNCTKCGAWYGQLGLEPTFEEFVEHLCLIFDEIKRILKPTGTCFVNLGDTYASGGGMGTEQSGRRKANNDTSSQPNFPSKAKLRATMGKSLLMIPERFAIGMIDRGWILRNKIIWHKLNALPSSATDRFTQDWEHIFFFTKNKQYYFEQQFEPTAESTLERDKYTRITKGKDGPYAVVHDHETISKPEGRNMRTVWSINTSNFREAHFATFPTDLVVPMVQSGCPKDGVVLDPFMGSGTTAEVAIQLKMNWLGVELNPEYIKIAEKRLKNYKIKHRVQLNYRGD